MIDASVQAGPPAVAPETKGERTREAVLAIAMDLASAEGLEALTIGRLARECHLSKSGLFAHFGSKEDLQLATVEAASRVFYRTVVRPANRAPSGLPRLWALLDNWLAYVEGKVFSGGCFFAAVGAEFDSRPGVVRDAVAAASADWLGRLASAVRAAQARREVRADVDPVQVAFEMNGFMLAANWAFELAEHPDAFRRARRAMHDRLRTLVAPRQRARLDELFGVPPTDA